MPELVAPALPPGALRSRTQPRLDLGAGLTIRPWEETDGAFVQAAFQDEEIQQWHARRLDTDDEATGWLALWRDRWHQETAASWAIARTSSGEAIGQVGLRDIRLGEARAHISYWVSPGSRGGGAATRAAAAVADWALETVRIERVGLAHAIDNAASCRVADRAGFTFEGTLRRYGLHADGWHDMHMHSRTSSDLFVRRSP